MVTNFMCFCLCISVCDVAHHAIKALVKCILGLYDTDATLEQLEYMSPDSYKSLNRMMSVTFHTKIKKNWYLNKENEYYFLNIQFIL